MKPGISVVIPTYKGREEFLHRALRSISLQTLTPQAIIIVNDTEREGASVTRTRGLMMVDTEWVAFLDDDDEMGMIHLERLKAHADETGADFVFSWFNVVGGTDPFPANEHREWTLDDPHQTTVTTLVRTEAAQSVGGFLWADEDVDPESPGLDSDGNRAGEEFGFTIKIARAGYKISQLHERTWLYHHHGGNTSGLPSRRR